MDNPCIIIPFIGSIVVLCDHYIQLKKTNNQKQILFNYNQKIKSHIEDMNTFKQFNIPNAYVQIIHNDSLKSSPIMTLINNSSIKQIKIKKHSFLNKYRFNSKIQCIFDVKRVNDILTLKEEFRWLESPQNRIILLTQNAYDNIDINSFSRYINTKTKIITVSDNDLISYLDIQCDKCFYIYYPPKLPFTLSTPEFVNQSLYPYFNWNPLRLLLKYKLFRDEMLIKNNNVYIKQQGVVKYAETFHHKIKDNMQKQGRHLFIYLPHWESINDDTIIKTLVDYNPVFDTVNITTSERLAKKLGLYQCNILINNIPQIFALHNNANRQVIKYNLTYFHFKTNYDLLYKNQLPEYISQIEIKGKSNVIEVNSNNFKDKVISDNSFKEFIIEISKENCPSCFILGKMLDHLSLKLIKHNIDKLKLFRIDSNNDIPYIGEFNATPTYLFCRKNNKGLIEYITQLNKDNFIEKLKEMSCLDLSKINYHKNLANGYLLYLNRYFEKDYFDPDFDLL